MLAIPQPMIINIWVYDNKFITHVSLYEYIGISWQVHNQSFHDKNILTNDGISTYNDFTIKQEIPVRKQHTFVASLLWIRLIRAGLQWFHNIKILVKMVIMTSTAVRFWKTLLDICYFTTNDSTIKIYLHTVVIPLPSFCYKKYITRKTYPNSN